LRARFVFRSVRWLSNLLLAAALLATTCSGVREYSVRHYLKGFSDTLVPLQAPPQQKAEAILAWMSNGPPRLEVPGTGELPPHDPKDTLYYRQLLAVCGSATNAFLNLSRSAGVETRRLLLLGPNRSTKHVVAEVHLGERWVIVDPSYRAFLKDVHGHLLTRKDLQNPEVFREAASLLPNYPAEYTYERFAHVRIAALPFRGAQVRYVLDHVVPGWEEYVDWSLLLERRSFLSLFLSVTSMILLVIARLILGRLADHRLQIPRFRLRTNLSRATAAFFTTPEIK